ncbi:MAG: GNAT family N-acetyltransferase [Neisseriaceae bacterium]|nr:GNAT family N-acetyltransferase [Neisseriaceae bacterium]MBR1818745.1 GNAT family N-acetyltransferase [Neisseriaceae bacterium]
MSLIIREFHLNDLPQIISIWNDIVADGIAFPQDTPLDNSAAEKFFAEQSFTGVAVDDNTAVGLYILHPNNVGRCAHIANASYAVDKNYRGQKIGEKLVQHSLQQAVQLGFKIMQFNAVVASNKTALRLYQKLGFTPLGVIKNGFRTKNSEFVDIIPHYIELQ